MRRRCGSKIQVQSICLSAHRLYPFGSANESTRQKAHDIIDRAMLFARGFGIRVIQLADYDVYFEPSTIESAALFL